MCICFARNASQLPNGEDHNAGEDILWSSFHWYHLSSFVSYEREDLDHGWCGTAPAIWCSVEIENLSGWYWAFLRRTLTAVCHLGTFSEAAKHIFLLFSLSLPPHLPVCECNVAQQFKWSPGSGTVLFCFGLAFAGIWERLFENTGNMTEKKTWPSMGVTQWKEPWESDFSSYINKDFQLEQLLEAWFFLWIVRSLYILLNETEDCQEHAAAVSIFSEVAYNIPNFDQMSLKSIMI